MNFFICRKCGYTNSTSSSDWKLVKVENSFEFESKMFCPKCNNDKFFQMEITIK